MLNVVGYVNRIVKDLKIDCMKTLFQNCCEKAKPLTDVFEIIACLIVAFKLRNEQSLFEVVEHLRKV